MRQHYLVVRIIALVTLLFFLQVPHASSTPPPTGIWCDTVQLPSEVPLVFYQPIWWNEYYQFNPTGDGYASPLPSNLHSHHLSSFDPYIFFSNVTFKLYASMQTNESFYVSIQDNYCPVMAPSSPIMKYPSNSSPFSSFSFFFKEKYFFLWNGVSDDRSCGRYFLRPLCALEW
jgi:hypothetical protein